jgi:hypothetical protein
LLSPLEPEIGAVQELLAIEAIKALKARYFRLVDTGDWAGLRLLFTDDARFEFSGLGHFDDVDAALAAIRAALGEATTVHHGHMPEITVTGPDTAEAIWAMDDYVLRGEGFAPIPGYAEEFQRGLHGYGHYFETYRREGRDWRIASLKLVRLHVEPLGRAGA